MSSNLPTVSVIVPAKDAADLLPRALESIRQQTYPNIVEVIVAAADDATAEAASGASVVLNPAGTTPAALNLAVAASSGEVIVRCDAQSRLPADYVSRAVETLTRTGAANVGGMQIPVGETKWENAIAAAMSSPFGAGDARYRIGGVEGAAETVYLGVFRREPLERLGGFNETFPRNQDYEMNHRFIEAGEVVWFDPALRVQYQPRGRLGELARQYLQYGHAKSQFARTHSGALRWRQLAAPTLTVVLFISLLISPWFPAALWVPATYFIALVIIGVRTGSGPLRVAAALATMHVNWGLGFLTGYLRSGQDETER